MKAGADYTRVYLSPHLDDAVLSCGGRVRQQVLAGDRVAVVTVFARAPEPGVPLSSYARDLHDRWGHPIEAVRQRQKEDREALALLGADVVHWEYLDCIYRRTPNGEYPYDSEAALWGPLHPSEAGLVRELAGRLHHLSLQPDGALYAPLAIGRHVDHRIVRAAAAECGRCPTYYEDFPYAADAEAFNANGLHTSLRDGPRKAELIRLSREELEAKIAAIACYRSQVSSFWTDPGEMAASVRAFATRVGAGVPAERYWQRTGRA